MKSVYFSKSTNELVLFYKYIKGSYFICLDVDNNYMWPVIINNKNDLVYIGEL